MWVKRKNNIPHIPNSRVDSCSLHIPKSGNANIAIVPFGAYNIPLEARLQESIIVSENGVDATLMTPPSYQKRHSHFAFCILIQGCRRKYLTNLNGQDWESEEKQELLLFGLGYNVERTRTLPPN